MEGLIAKGNDITETLTKKNTVSGSLRILIPLYITYIIFVLSIFLIFIPLQEKQLLDQKKETIRQLTNSVLSLLAKFDSKIKQNEISPEEARKDALNQIRYLRYGPEGKDYFWINDMHPFMIMHPFRPDLEGKDLTRFKDAGGTYPFVAMVEMALKNGGGYVDYYWQWKDIPQKVVPKISFVKEFHPWGWIIGTGIYVEDIDQDIQLITQKFIRIFGGLMIFIILLSLYISRQVFRIEKKKNLAQKSKDLEELRLKKLLELSQMTKQSMDTLTEFALEEAINLTNSQIGYLAFLNKDESQLTLHTWSKQTMKQCEIDDKTLVYNVADTGLWAEAARTRKPMIINDYHNFTGSGKKGYPAGHVRISRVMNVPIFDGDKIVALTGVGNKKEAYDESDIRQLELMMDGMWKILQQKKAEDALRRSEERYRLLADNATDAIWILQLSDFTFSYVSPVIEHISGYPPSEFIGQKFGDHMTQNSLEKISAIISRELDRDIGDDVDTKRFRVIETQMIQKSGSKIWTEVTACFLRDHTGKPDRILGITRDITQRKDLEKRLVESNTDLRLAQRIAGVGNWATDPETGIRTWSDVIYQIFERDPKLDPYPHADLQKICVGKSWEKFSSANQRAITEGLAYNIEVKVALPSGKVKWAHVICEPEPEPGRKGHYLRGTIQDITERKTMEVRIQQIQKMEALGTLAGGIAHDFNNILSAIFGFTELAKLRSKGDQDTLNKLNKVLTAGLRAKELVKHILTFSRKSDAQKDRVRVATLLKECLKFLKASISPDIDIQLHISKTDGIVLADPTQLHQVFMNLFTNAAFAMKEKGGILDVSLNSIDISADDICQLNEITPGHYIQLTISDTGCGIPKTVIGKIFEPFFTTKAKGEGTGMGLSLVYGIIKEMKGNISVHSEPGAGTIFQILVPEQMDGFEKNENTGTERLITGKGRILVVDDEIPITDWTSQILVTLGYEVVSTNKALDAVEKFKQNPLGYDLILTDLTMPGMSGLELSAHIKSKRPDIPIVLSTGFSEGVTSEAIKTYGISDMIMKPMIASELARIISESLTKGRLED